MLSSTLLRASQSTRTRRAVEAFPPTRRVVNRFVVGETVPDAVDAAHALAQSHRAVSVDVLGEDIHDAAGATRIRDAYLSLLAAFSETGVAAGADVSLKLSALGQGLPDVGEELAYANARSVCAAAAAGGYSVTLDMEDHSTVDSTLLIGAQLRAEFPSVGNVLQSNLKRTPGDIDRLADTGARIRVVKGAYREPASVAHQRKSDVDRAYRADIEALMRSTCHPMIATHDPSMLQRASESAGRHGRGAADWEVQMLYGIRPDLQEELVDTGRQLRVYVPFGTDWYGYFMRRLAERPANVAFFLRALAHKN